MMIQDPQFYGYNSSIMVIPNQSNNIRVPFYQPPQYSVSNSCLNVSNPLMPRVAMNSQLLPSHKKNVKLNIHSKASALRVASQKNKNKSKDDKNQRKKFSPEEDEKLRELVEKMGSRKWDAIAKEMPGRTGRQCRDRYKNYLVPGFFNGQWSPEEDRLLYQKYIEYGSQWSKITQFFKNRSANSLKNRWNYFVSKHIEFPFNPTINSILCTNANSMNVSNDTNNSDIDNEESNNDDVFCEGIMNYNASFNYYIDSAFDLYSNDPIISNDLLDFKEDSLNFP